MSFFYPEKNFIVLPFVENVAELFKMLKKISEITSLLILSMQFDQFIHIYIIREKKLSCYMAQEVI